METQRKLIDAMIQLAHKKNYDRITVQELCRAAGVSTGSFYHQFGTKDGLALAAYQSVDWLLTDDFTAEYSHLPPLHALDRLLRKYICYVRDEIGPEIGQYYRVLLNHPSVHRYDRDRPYCQEICRILKQAMDQNIISTQYTPEELTDLVMRLVRGLLFDWVLQGDQYDLLGHYEMEYRIFFFGMRKNPEDSTS